MTDDAAQSIIRSPMTEARPPTVLQILPALDAGGVERGTVDIAAAVTAAGWNALVVSAGGPMVREILRAGATHVTLPVDSKNPVVMRRNIDRLVDLILDNEVDIVHARSRAPAWSAMAAAARAGRHFVTTYHAPYSGGSVVKRWYNSVMARGERVIAISEYVAGELETRHGLDRSRIRKIHRGIDVDRFHPDHVSAERVIQLAKQWRLPDGVPVVMLPGRLTRWKGHSVLIEALARMKRADLRCLLVGPWRGHGGYRRELEKSIRERGLAGAVHLIDGCRDMPAAYMLADVVVSASVRPEAFGRVAAEAQAMGRMVVATDHGGARETVRAGETGWLVTPGDAAALAEAITAALALEPEARDSLGAVATAHIRDRFSKADMCARTLDVYREVLASGALGARAA